MGKIIVLGVFVADTSFRASRLPKIGETILGESFALGPGGKGSNQAVAAGKLGADVTIITCIGDDEFGKMALRTWQDAGVTPAVKKDRDAYTGAACIYVDSATGDNAIIISPGAAAEIDTDIIMQNQALIADSDVFITQLEQPIEAAHAGLKLAREHGSITILNPAPAAELPADIFPLCDYATPNESEAEALTGISVRTAQDAEHAAAILAEKGVKTPIITMGEQGAFLYGHGMVPTFNAGAVVETTGAGDAFNGALATALANGHPPVEAVRFGCATAAISVTRAGAASSMPLKEEVDRLLG